MLIKWYGHSCFVIEADGYSVAIDPYDSGSVPGLSPLRLAANKLLCTHEHFDHNNRGAVKIEPSKTSPFRFSTVKSWHDDAGGTKRGKNSIYILEADGLRVAHFGDLGCRLDEAQIKAVGRLDAALIPVGGCYTVDSAVAAGVIRSLEAVRVVIPMHYRTEHSGFGVLATVDGFIKALPEWACYEYGSEFTLDKDTEPQLAVLSV